jgi:hypothetical protein
MESAVLTTRFFAVSSAALGLLAAGPAFAVGSSAFGLSADLTIGAKETAIGPVNPLNSPRTDSYNKSVNSGTYQKTAVIASGAMAPTLTITADNFRSHVDGIQGKDGRDDDGEAMATGFSLILAPPKGASPGISSLPFLQITANKLQETGSYGQRTAGSTVSGVAAIGGLSVTGTLVANRTLKFSGAPTASKVLYQSPTVTVTLNRQFSTALISCTVGKKGGCVYTPYGVRTAALEVTLTDALIGERKISGTITVGGGQAGLAGGL